MGLLYGLGVKNLSSQLSCSEQEAEQLRNSVLNEYPKLREYVESQQQYPFDNSRNSAGPGHWGPGTINTFFGDRLYLREWDYLKKAKDDRERNNIIARIKRLAVNLVIQGGTSTAMASGFYSDVREAIKKDWVLTSLLTVHDSNVTSFKISRLWSLKSHFDTNFTEFCYKMTGIKLLFDILVGADYHNTCEVKQISDDVIQLRGSAKSHLLILNQMDHCRGLKYEIDMPRDQIIPDYVESPMLRFLMEKGCSLYLDKSNYTINYKKLS